MDDDRKYPENRDKEELFRAFDRERSKAHELNRRHEEEIRNARDRDRQGLIERRRNPR